MIERPLHEKYTAVFSPTKAVEGLTREQWLEKIPNVDAVIVLGSGLTESAEGKESRINMHGKMRALAAYELYQAGKAHHIIVTGGIPVKGTYDRSMALAEKEYLTEKLQVDSNAVLEELGNSENFWRNSLFDIMPLWLPFLWWYGFVAIKRSVNILQFENH